MLTSLVLTILAGMGSDTKPFIDQVSTPPAANQESEPAKPSVPLSE
jgi:hypothetical protein